MIVNCRRIYSVVLRSELHLLHLRPIITLVASTPVSSAEENRQTCMNVKYLYV